MNVQQAWYLPPKWPPSELTPDTSLFPIAHQASPARAVELRPLITIIIVDAPSNMCTQMSQEGICKSGTSCQGFEFAPSSLRIDGSLAYYTESGMGALTSVYHQELQPIVSVSSALFCSLPADAH